MNRRYGKRQVQFHENSTDGGSIIIMLPDQWNTEESQGTINSNHLNRKLQLQCCGDGSNESNTSEM